MVPRALWSGYNSPEAGPSTDYQGVNACVGRLVQMALNSHGLGSAHA